MAPVVEDLIASANIENLIRFLTLIFSLSSNVWSDLRVSWCWAPDPAFGRVTAHEFSRHAAVISAEGLRRSWRGGG